MATIRNHSSFKVREIRSSYGIYKLGTPAMIIDEGSFYRVNGTFIIDKYRIKSVELVSEKLTIHLENEDIILIVEK